MTTHPFAPAFQEVGFSKHRLGKRSPTTRGAGEAGSAKNRRPHVGGRCGASATRPLEGQVGSPPTPGQSHTPQLSSTKICLLGYFIPKKPPFQQKPGSSLDTTLCDRKGWSVPVSAVTLVSSWPLPAEDRCIQQLNVTPEEPEWQEGSAWQPPSRAGPWQVLRPPQMLGISRS